MARPTDYGPHILELFQEYLDECVDDLENKKVNIPTVHGLAIKLKLSRETIYAWCKDPEKKIFSDMFNILKEEQGKRLVNNGLAGTYSNPIAKLLLSSKHGYVEKTATANIEVNSESLSEERVDQISKAIDDL